MHVKRMLVFPLSTPNSVVEKGRQVNRKRFVFPSLPRQNLLLLCNERSCGHLSGYVNTHNAHLELRKCSRVARIAMRLA
ncbi:hypothetical protein TNCV_3020091 [Trichonephila clavipes]|nr:hypothetical protein TNCV_3020091 [Trichonephila clavipes]